MKKSSVIWGFIGAVFVAAVSIALWSCTNPVASTPPTTYTVTYMANGATAGSVPSDTNKYQAGAAVTVLGNTGTLVRPGWTMSVDWNTAANGSGASYPAGSTLDMGAGNVVLYAQWSAPMHWAWMSGSTFQAAAGVYGTVGTASSSNVPGAREGGASCTDASGNLWLFGGYYTSGAGTNYYNDLWKFDATNYHAWVLESGSGTANGGGVYGTQGSAAAGNTPGGRAYASCWVDSSGNFWLFGGDGYDGTVAAPVLGLLNDLWMFSPTSGQWTWETGSTAANTGGTYGTRGTAGSTNTPGARGFSPAWKDASGNFWLFGGEGYDGGKPTLGALNDLWKFDGTNWTWESGSSTANAAGVYGTQGVATSTNVPSSRVAAQGTLGPNGKFWIFGGGSTSSAPLNDLWSFDPTTGQWTWESGSGTANTSGAYGTQGTPAPSNVPGARFAGFLLAGPSGNLWLFGGTPAATDGTGPWYNDLWEYDIPSNEWTWVSGSSTTNQYGSYGTFRTAAASNAPGSRWSISGWVGPSGGLWLFGGDGYDNGKNTADGYLNDLWRFGP